MRVDLLLKNYVESSGIDGALLVSDDGTILMSRLPEYVSTSIIDRIEWIQKTIYAVSIEIQRNNLHRVTYELEDGIVLFTKVSSGLILVGLAPKDIDMSRVTYVSSVYSKAINTEIRGIKMAEEGIL